jgi:hypothetical protein
VGPLLVAMVSARLVGGQSFPIDWGVHARLLVAIPLLLRADVSLHARTRFVASQLVADGWVAAQQERFDRIVASAIRHRDSIFPRSCCSVSRCLQASSWCGTSAARPS